MVGEQRGGKEKIEEKPLAIITLALLLTNVKWGKVFGHSHCINY